MKNDKRTFLKVKIDWFIKRIESHHFWRDVIRDPRLSSEKFLNPKDLNSIFANFYSGKVN